MCIGNRGTFNPTTLAALVTTLGTSVSTLETILGNTAVAAQIKTDTAALSAAIASWKSGSPTQDIIEAIGLVESDLNLIPVDTETVALIDLALGTLQGILILFPPAQAAVAQSKAVVGSVKPIRQVKLNKTPKNSPSYIKQWNTIVDNTTLRSELLLR